MVDLEEIRKRAEKATPGPWRKEDRDWDQYNHPTTRIIFDRNYVEGVTPTIYCLASVTYPATHPNTIGTEERHATADFIAHARTDIPALLAALDAKTAEVEMLDGELQEMTGRNILNASALKSALAREADLKRQLAEARKQLGAFVGAWDECAGEEGDTFPQRFTDAVVRNLNAQEIKHD